MGRFPRRAPTRVGCRRGRGCRTRFHPWVSSAPPSGSRRCGTRGTVPQHTSRVCEFAGVDSRSDGARVPDHTPPTARRTGRQPLQTRSPAARRCSGVRICDGSTRRLTADAARRRGRVRWLSDVGCVRARGRRYSTSVQVWSVGRQAHSSATSRTLNAAPTAYARSAVKISTSKIVGLRSRGARPVVWPASAVWRSDCRSGFAGSTSLARR